MLEPNFDTIAVLDCGGQYAHLIANRIRRLHAFSEIFSPETPASELKNAKGIIISGGPQSVFAEDSPQVDKGIFELGIPILGICYGHQLVAHTLGGTVKPGKNGEYGKTFVQQKGATKDTIFAGWKEEEQVWMSHGDEVISLPEGFELSYSSHDCSVAAMSHIKRHIYGVQFHAEVTHTPSGIQIFKNFLDICQVKKEWSMQTYLADEVQKIKDQVGERNVFLLTSGGVDSTVAFLLLSQALGKERVYGLFVDTGFMRKNEVEEVETSLKKLGFDNLHVADAQDHFFKALNGVSDPETKRKIAGSAFLDIKDQWAEKIGLDSEQWLLGQGTIYPDTIESGGTKHAATIKTHHNRIDQIEKLILEGRIVEPLKELYKDEVRELGIALGLPEALVWRHPFPGPGLIIRVLCGEENSPLDSSSELEQNITNDFEYPCKILPIKSVGVQGDSRSYAHPLVIFPENHSIDWEAIDQASTAITNKYKAINRVVLCLSHNKAAENVTFHPSTLNPSRVKLLQEIDAIVKNWMIEHNLMRSIWQFPVVLLPIGNENQKESVVLRPVDSEEAMTANFSRLDPELLQELSQRIMQHPEIAMVLYDITNKPPATIEWE